MRISLLFACILCMCTNLVFAQKTASDYPIAKKIEKAKQKATFSEYTIATAATTNLESEGIPKSELESGKLIDLDMQVINNLRSQNPEALSLSFPMPKQANAKVNLVKNDVLTPDFIFRLSSNPDQVADYTPGLYYSGVLDNDPSSLVSISIFEDEVIGVISTNEGNYVIGKLQNSSSNKHIIYKDSELNNSPALDCGTQDDGVVYEMKDLTFDLSKTVGDCVRVYIEIDDDIVTNKGGAVPATNYITGAMNQVITLYANDAIVMAVSEILAWTTPAPYSGSSSSAMLTSYQNNTGTFNGDLSHLVSYQASGGIAAGFSGICNSNPDLSKCFSSIDATYSNVPTYSFTIMVMTHEMGHLIGSRHTHACVWNGNGTAIDGCAGGVEGSCSLPGSPAGGGTIMSYCHLTTGINFTLGFGPQPKAVLLNTIANATCLSGCAGPTCTDGVQNGGETGVDCGGPNCPPCETGCTSNDVNVNITFDNYPEETSWTITNSSGTTVASGGPYGSQPDGSSLTVPLCLVNGCYTFTIYDSYGDGICCAYGNGSYSVTDGSGNVLASGGSFTSSQATTFCLNGGGPILGCTNPAAHNYNPAATQDDGSCETCTDGVQNGDETGTDCGGVLCAPCSGPVTIFGHYFESGWDGWADGGVDCRRYTGTRSYEGTYSIELRDNSGVASSMTSSVYNMSSYASAELEFYFYANSMEVGEDFWVQRNSGSGWVTIATYARGTNFNNNTFYVATISNITGLSSTTQFRFRCDASDDNDQIYIDAVTLRGNTGSGLVENPINYIIPISKVENGSAALMPNANTPLENDILMYPNPAESQLNLESDSPMQAVHLYAANGQLMKTIPVEDHFLQMDITALQAGFYYLSVRTEAGVRTMKFVKR